jgi:hypothetical protein
MFFFVAAAKKHARVALGQPGWQAFLLSHAKAPLREEKRDAIAKLVTTRINSNHPPPVLAMLF